MYPTVYAGIAALAAWLSTGTLALASEDGPRIALLPLSPVAAALAAAAGLLVFALLRAGAPAAPLTIVGLTLLPWIPLPVPAAFFAWSGHLRIAVWGAALALMASGIRSPGLRARAESVRMRARFRERPHLRAAVLSLVIAGAAAWSAAPMVPGGDEPHYLVITQSLLLDGDLKIENNHQRGDYRVYFAGALRPDYIRRGRDGEIYSIHAPGISVLVAPAFALGGYRAVVLFLVALAACGGALIWHVAWLATRNAAAAWFGWAAIVATPTWIFHSFTVYPDGVGGLLTLTGVWALLRADKEPYGEGRPVWPWVLHGLALAALPWLHTRFSVLAGVLGALILLRLRRTRHRTAKSLAFLSVPALSALGWIGYFVAVYGTADPGAPYGSAREFSTAFIPGGLAGLLFDQRFGLLATAPVLICAIFGFGSMWGARRRVSSVATTTAPLDRRLAFELVCVLASYLLTVTQFAMWWGGWSAPARFAAAVLPALAVPCAAAWAGFRTQAARVMAVGALGVTLFIATVLVTVERGRLAYNTRDAYALWLDWASRLADLGRGAPAWFRDQEQAFFLEVIVWAVALTAAGVVCRLAARHRLATGTAGRATAATLLFALAAMIALTVTWNLRGVSGTTAAPAQLELLRRVSSEPRVLLLGVAPPSRLSADSAAAMMRIEVGPRDSRIGGAGGAARPLVTLPAMPAGRYRVRPRTRGPGGLLTVGIGQDEFALHALPLDRPPPELVVDFPVAVRALIVRGDDAAHRTVREVTIEPVALVAPGRRLTSAVARRAARYAGTAVFFLDERSFPEPDAFWVGGARSAALVLQPASSERGVRLLLRNAPVDNQVVISAGAWRRDLGLRPGEERSLAIPVDADRGAVLVEISSSGGFRPSEVEPGSRDERFLGVWVQPH